MVHLKHHTSQLKIILKENGWKTRQTGENLSQLSENNACYNDPAQHAIMILPHCVKILQPTFLC